MLEAIKTDHEDRLHGISQLQSQLTFRFSVLSKLLDQQMTAIAARHGLSLIEYRLLATLEAFGTLSSADLARYTGYDKAAVSRATKTIIEEGLMDVRDDPDHGRRRILSLTDAGTARLEAAKPEVAARRDGLSAQLDAGEEEIFLRVIDKLAEHTDASLRALK
jgi:DNA-binding MarR family transcriptional regulator